MNIQTKRVYDAPSSSDGLRVLIDRLWPRGLSKEAASIDRWAKEVSPSNELRKWYRHDPAKWHEFRTRYFAELDQCPEAIAELRSLANDQVVTLVFGSKEERLNNATALRDYLMTRR